MSQTRRIPFSDLVTREARRIATLMLQEQLESQGLPLPKDTALEIHLDHLLALRPDLLKRAADVVNARQDAYSEALRTIGLDVEITVPITPIEIEL